MKDIQQLIKKNSQEGRYENIFPKTFIDAVKDKESGKSLTDILSSFNMYFLSYNGSREQTRLQVPMSIRKTGLWITYVLYDKTVVTEWYAGEAIDDDSWKNLSNWRDGTNSLVGDISISSDGYWVVNGVITTTKAQGEQGITPMLRVGSNNHLQASYTNGSSWVDVSTNPVYTQFRINNNKLEQSVDLGQTWTVVSDYIASWFRFTGTTGSSQADNVGKIQISRDNGVTWSDLSGEFTNSLHIKGYVATIATLPSSAVQGDIYGVGPTYDPSDTEHTNPIYQLYVKDSTGWVNNGRFTSISAGVVQELGNSETSIISQKGINNLFTGKVKYVGEAFQYKTIQSAINDSTFGDVILIYPGEYNEGAVSINGRQNLTITSYGETAQYRVKVNGTFTLSNSIRIEIENIEMEALTITNNSDLCYFNNIAVNGKTVISVAVNGYIRFDNCYFGNFNNHNQKQTDIRNCQFENSVLLAASDSGESAILSVFNTTNLNLSHQGGSVLVSGYCMFKVVDPNTRYVIASTVSSANCVLRLDGGTTLLSDGTYGVVYKSGNCPYSISNFIYEPSISTLNGTKIDGGLHSNQIYDHKIRQGYTNVSSELLEHLNGISNSLLDKEISKVEIVSGKNILNDSLSLEGYYVNTSGSLSLSENYRATYFIPVSGETEYVLNFSSGIYIVEFDSNFNVVKSSVINQLPNRVLTTTANTAYIRTAINKSTIYPQIEKGNVSTVYEPYTPIFNIGKIGRDNVDFISPFNLYKEEEIIENSYINSTGSISSSADYNVSGFIPISEGEYVYCNAQRTNLYIAIYDVTFKVIAVQSGANLYATGVANSAYCRFTLVKNITPIVINKGQTPKYAIQREDSYRLDPSLIELPDRIVKISNTNFIQDANLYREDEITPATYINTSGTLVANPAGTYNVSGYIRIDKDQYIYCNAQRVSTSICMNLYDASKNRLQTLPGALVVKGIVDGGYVRFTMKATIVPHIHLGSVPISYVAPNTKMLLDPDIMLHIDRSELDSTNSIKLPSKLYMLSDTVHDIFVEPISKFTFHTDIIRFGGTQPYTRNMKRTAKISNPIEGRTVQATLYDQELNVKTTTTSSITVGEKGVGTTPIKIQIVGDSFTASQFYKDSLLKISNGYVPNLQMVGLRKYSGTGYNIGYDEGRGGWRLSDYFEIKKSNGTTGMNYAGFWQPNDDFKYWGCVEFWKIAKNTSDPLYSTYYHGRYTDQLNKYATTGYLAAPTTNDLMWSISSNSLQKWDGTNWINVNESDYTWSFQYSKYLSMFNLDTPDMIFVMLGVNDFRNTSSGYTEWINRMNTFINSFKEINPNGKFIVVIHCTVIGQQDADTNNFIANQDKNMFAYRELVINTYDNRESENIYVVDSDIMIDNIYGYDYTEDELYTKPFDTYTGSKRLSVQTGQPHPYASYPAMGLPIAAFIQKFRN